MTTPSPTEPTQRGFAPENEGRPAPTLVQFTDQAFDAAVKADNAAGVIPSANRKFWARGVDDQYVESNRATNDAQVAAFVTYQQRPDIESRSSILARENAQPAQFENVVVPNGDFNRAVDNAVPMNESGYIGSYQFEDGFGVRAGASNGQGQVLAAEYTAPTFVTPGTAPAGLLTLEESAAAPVAAVDTDGDGAPDSTDASPNDPTVQ